MYNRPYMPNYNQGINQQTLAEQIDSEIERLKQMKTQRSQPIPAINQTFQLAPNHSGMRYVNTIDDVSKEAVYNDTPFFSKDLSVLWIKNSKGDIKTYELKEIVKKDEKDLQIDYLISQINELKGMMNNEQSNSNDIQEQDATDTSTDDRTTRTTIKEVEPTSIQRVSRTKAK